MYQQGALMPCDSGKVCLCPGLVMLSTRMLTGMTTMSGMYFMCARLSGV